MAGSVYAVTAAALLGAGAWLRLGRSALDDATAFGRYDHDPGMSGATWFAAGLRSSWYKNLGGRGRRHAI